MKLVRWRVAAVLLFFVTLAARPVLAAEVSPEGVKAAIPELDRFVGRILEKTGVPGLAIAVVCKDQVIHLKGYGVREAGKPAQVDADTVFQLASMSKPLASTVLAVVVGEGSLGWDDRIIDRDAGFRLADPFVTREVTIRDLLCHRSGLPDHAGDLLEDLGYDRPEVLRRLRFEKPGNGFRSQYAYTNFGFTEAAVAGARAVGSAWEELAAEKLFRPLGMTSSSYRFADYAAAENRARLHVRDGDRWVARYTRQPDAQAPAGGASSTARDMSRWLRVQLAGGRFEGKPLIAAKALAETHQPQIVSHRPDDPATDRAGFYALGWTVNYEADGRVRLGHSGAFSLGAATAVTLLPADGLGIVVLTGTAPFGVPEAVSASFLDLVLKGKIEKDWLEAFRPLFAAMNAPAYGTATDYTRPPAAKSPPLPLETYVGTYRNDYFGDLDVAEHDGGLQLRLGPKRTSFALKHWDRDVFTYRPDGENAGGPSAVTFRVGPGRKADRVVVEILDTDGQGTFSRSPTTR